MLNQKINELLKRRNTLARKQQILCDYLLTHMEDTMTMTATEVATAAGVSKATLFRFINDFGYNSFLDFLRDLYNYSSANIFNNYWHTQKMLATPSTGQSKINKSLFDYISNTSRTLDKLLTPALDAAFEQAVKALINAKQLGVIGFRTSKNVAEYFEGLLLPTPLVIPSLCNGGHLVFDRITKMPQGSVIFVIGRQPHTTTTIKAAEYAHSLGHTIILLTDSLACSMASFADIILTVPQILDEDSITMFVIIIDAIAQELYKHFHSYTSEFITQVSKVLRDNNMNDSRPLAQDIAEEEANNFFKSNKKLKNK